jgi:hypothetical protein
MLVLLAACTPATDPGASDSFTPVPLASDARMILLHHSTGGCIWAGGLPALVAQKNAGLGTTYSISEQAFPQASPYGWQNYPYDYWNIWVDNAGASPFIGEPTLEMLSAQYQLILFKHCFPVSSIEPDTGSPDIRSQTKSIENYKLQYIALKGKMREFSSTRFLVWTGAALRAEDTTPEQAARAQQFSSWVKNTWDETGDNIFVWDFRELETDGGLYLTPDHASSDSHPNATFSQEAAVCLCQRIFDVAQGTGDQGSLTGR